MSRVRLTILAMFAALAVAMVSLTGVASAAALDTLKQPPFPPTDVSLFNLLSLRLPAFYY